MKMKLGGFLSFAFLSIMVLSYGVSSSAFADDHNIPPLSASAELPSYDHGDKVIISGNVKDFDSKLHAGHAVTYVVLTPDGKGRVAIGQLVPNSDGSFQFDFNAGGPLWKSGGDYVVQLNFASMTGETSLVFTGEAVVDDDVPPVTCTSNQDLVDGECIDKPPPPPAVTCTSNQDLVDGECIDKPPPPPAVTCTSNQDLVDGECIDKPPVIDDITCGLGTKSVNGVCTIIQDTDPDDKEKESCLIATAAYGTELAPQVQFLREIRDNTVLTTQSGMTFMTGFNALYYSFAPTVADWERENPMFQEAVRAFITPMISSLSIMSLAEGGSESEVLGFGISVIVLNLGMYIAAPALIGFQIHKQIKSRK